MIHLTRLTLVVFAVGLALGNLTNTWTQTVNADSRSKNNRNKNKNSNNKNRNSQAQRQLLQAQMQRTKAIVAAAKQALPVAQAAAFQAQAKMSAAEGRVKEGLSAIDSAKNSQDELEEKKAKAHLKGALMTRNRYRKKLQQAAATVASAQAAIKQGATQIKNLESAQKRLSSNNRNRNNNRNNSRNRKKR